MFITLFSSSCSHSLNWRMLLWVVYVGPLLSLWYATGTYLSKCSRTPCIFSSLVCHSLQHISFLSACQSIIHQFTLSVHLLQILTFEYWPFFLLTASEAKCHFTKHLYWCIVNTVISCIMLSPFTWNSCKMSTVVVTLLLFWKIFWYLNFQGRRKCCSVYWKYATSSVSLNLGTSWINSISLTTAFGYRKLKTISWLVWLILLKR